MPLDPKERWRRVEELFYRALECSPEERSTRLAEWCAGDGELREEVNSLLAGVAAADQAAAHAVASKPPAAPEVDPWIGRTIGHFRLERLIARGGMGAVYFGRRITGDFAQEIAFKLASSRLTSPWLRQRFLLERQTLASLHHPNIARLLDGGLTAEGEPFLVMEYVEGQQLDVYCDHTVASVADIVRLLLELCDAVSFVHRNLIIHRDLKPANVLVTPEGRVKLLDFGAAKLLNPDPHLGADATQPGLRALTPQYASPEAIAGDTTTAASDVYSLGVILYRLLAGRLPYNFEGLSSAGMVQTALETRPVPPHAAVKERATGSAGDTGLAADPALRRKQIRGDLDAIVLKTLNADPKDRYPSVDELAADLRSFLEHRPVGAREASLAYRTAMFARRHALGVGAAAAIVIAIAVGVAATAWEARVARSEEHRAVEGFRITHHLANLLLFNFYDEVKQLQGSTGTQRRLVSQALTYLDSLSKEARGDLDVQLDLVEAYTKMGAVLGDPYEENLGDAASARVSLEKAVQLAESAEKLRPQDPLVIRRLSAARRNLADVHFSTGDTALAIKYSSAAAHSFEELAMRPGASVTDVQEAASTFDSLGDLYGMHGSASLGDLASALDSYRHALTLEQRALVLAPGNVRSLRGLAIHQMKIANCHSDTQPVVAAQEYQEALASLGRLPAEARQALPTVRLASVLNHKLGDVYVELGRVKEAIPYFESSHRLYASGAARDPEDVRVRFDITTVDYDLGQAREKTADRVGARRDYTEAAQILEAILRRDPANIVWLGHRSEVMYRIGCIDRDLGKTAEGDRTLHEALSIAVRVARSHDASAEDLNRAADYLSSVKPIPWREPRVALQFALQAVERSRGTNAPYLLTLARAQQDCGKPADARGTLQKALALLPAPQAGQPPTQLRASAEKLMDSLSRQYPPKRVQ